MKADHPFLRYSEAAFARQPLRLLKGATSRYLAYPYAEAREHRTVRPKVAELRDFYRQSAEQRRAIGAQRLEQILTFAGAEVPYYRDLFRSIGFDPRGIAEDTARLDALPYLTKDIIREQGDRMLSQPLAALRHHICKTGGSTGLSCTIFYDQEAADYSSAVTAYARERIGAYRHRPALHFACRFPGDPIPEWPSREDFKCFAMNRSNIFFDRLDDVGLEEIWQTLQRRRPYLMHAHPSTIYALACYIERQYGGGKAFAVFESSGELLEAHMRAKIASVLRCRVIDRYGLAELGVMAYQVGGADADMQVFESEGWAESRLVSDGVDGTHELVLTSYRNKLMPLIRYATGDMARVDKRADGFYLADVVGRIHDVVPINGIPHPTHHIQDILDHRVGGIQEFQIDLRSGKPLLRLVLEASAQQDAVLARVNSFWGDAFDVRFVGHDDLIRVGHRAKFRHVVNG